MWHTHRFGLERRGRVLIADVMGKGHCLMRTNVAHTQVWSGTTGPCPYC